MGPGIADDVLPEVVDDLIDAATPGFRRIEAHEDLALLLAEDGLGLGEALPGIADHRPRLTGSQVLLDHALNLLERGE